MSALPVLAVTLGDPAGIGPEIVLRLLADTASLPARLLLVGDGRALERERPHVPGVALPPVVDGPEAWNLKHIEGIDDWRFSLDDATRDALVASSLRAAADGLDVFQVGREQFRLPDDNSLFADIHRQVEQGLGFALLLQPQSHRVG